MTDAGRAASGATSTRAEQPGAGVPLQLTAFVGRDAELDLVRSALADHRLVTLTGSGGCGKTRLANEVWATVANRYRDGVWWVDLAPLGDASLVAATLAGVLGVGATPTEPVGESVLEALASRQALVVLDNCEHLIDACAELATSIVQRCPATNLLATSREPLGVQGERLVQVPPLSLPTGSSIDEITASEAVRLFVDRAKASRASFELNSSNGRAVAEICARLDGIPLAIELAAARTRALSVDEIAAGLADRFNLLTGGIRWALPRQRTLEGSVAWSHELLHNDERAVFRRLAVFAGSFTLEAAQAVCRSDDLDAIQVLANTVRLVDRSLIQVVEAERPQSRFRLLETIRAYALARLDESGEHDATRERHLGFYAELTSDASAGLQGADLTRWLARIDAERDNVRAALDWSTRSADPTRAVQMIARLALYWFARSDLTIGRDRLEAVLDSAGGDGLDHVDARSALCIICYRAGDMTGAARHGAEAVAAARRHHNPASLGRALLWRAAVRCWGESDRRGAWTDFEEATQLLDESDDHVHRALNLAFAGWSYVDTSDATRARPLLDRALALTDRTGSPHARCYTVLVAGYVDLLGGRLGAAAARLGAALDLAITIGDHYAELFARGFLAYTELNRGRYLEAQELCEEGLASALRHRSPMCEGLVRGVLAELAFADGDFDQAGRELQRSYELLETLWLGAAAGCRAHQAELALARDEVPVARAHAAEALRLARATDTVRATVKALHTEASLARLDADARRAEDLLHEALDLACRAEHTAAVWDLLDALAGVAADVGRYGHAARLLGAASGLREAAGAAHTPARRQARGDAIAAVRENLGAEALELEWAAGAALSIHDAVAYARRGRGERRRPSHGWDSLTPTELQVADLAAEGLTNPQIGERLFVSRRTVQTHLAHIFSKLGISTRAELAARVGERRALEV